MYIVGGKARTAEDACKSESPLSGVRSEEGGECR